MNLLEKKNKAFEDYKSAKKLYEKAKVRVMKKANKINLK